MSILSTSPTSIRVFDVNIANALGSSEAATILQQLHYWMQKKGVGVIVDGIKYVYNTFRQWVREQFVYLTDSKFIRAMKILRSLEIVKVIRHKAKQWNQTNHYSLDYQKLREWGEAENIEISELADNSPQDDSSQPLEMSDSSFSYIDTKITNKKEQQSNIAASLKKSALGDGSDPEKVKDCSVGIASPSEENKQQLEPNRQNTGEVKSLTKIDCIVNLKWKEQIKDLDSAGIPINKTLTFLLKSHKSEQVENAISLFKARKKEQYIPNPCGYFVTVLKENWANENPIDIDSEIDTASVFRYWYNLAKELGYCSGQEMKEGKQWVCISGVWEKWSHAVKRGYSIDYLKKILKRNKG